jgi:methanogen extracellular protein (TIGR04279 family)
VKAVGADDLNVRAKKLLWLTKSKEATDGTATVSQANVPSGTYKIRIDGKASGSNVKLKITAMQEVEVNSEGSLSYLYSTKSIPAGNFEVEVGGATKQIELKPSESLPSETNFSEQNSSEEKDNESLGSEINSSEHNSSEVEVYNWTNSLESQEAKTEIKAYNWTDIQGSKSITPEIKAEKNSWNNMKFILSYPYSLRPFYTVNESVKLSYIGPETLGQQNVNIYLIKEHSPGFPENDISCGMNESTISLEDVLNNNIESYIQIPATLNEGGDLSPLTLDPLQAGSYWILMTLAGNETGNPESEKEILLAKHFEILEYEMEAGAPYALQEGENLEVSLRLKNAPAEKNYTYWAVLIKDSAYTASEGTNLRWRMTTGIRPIVNGVDLIKSLETSLRGYESKNEKDELKNEVQTLIGEDNGTIIIGEKNQSNLYLKSLQLTQGDYLLLTGAYENSEGMVGISQKKLRISPENSYGLGLKSSSGNTFGGPSSTKFKASPLMEIKSILENPKAFIFEDIKPYIQANSLAEVLRNPPKLPSFLLGFAGTLLIGFVVLRKKK